MASYFNIWESVNDFPALWFHIFLTWCGEFTTRALPKVSFWLSSACWAVAATAYLHFSLSPVFYGLSLSLSSSCTLSFTLPHYLVSLSVSLFDLCLFQSLSLIFFFYLSLCHPLFPFSLTLSFFLFLSLGRSPAMLCPSSPLSVCKDGQLYWNDKDSAATFICSFQQPAPTQSCLAGFPLPSGSAA